MKKPAILLALVLLGTHPTEITASSPIGKVRVPKLPAQQQIHNLSELKEKHGPVETAEAENGRIKSLIVDFIPLHNWKRESAIEAIAQFIGEIAPVLGIPDPENYLFADVQILPDGGQRTVFKQTYRGLDVWESAVSVHSTKRGELILIQNDTIEKLPDINLEPRLTAEQAVQVALKEENLTEESLDSSPSPQLVVNPFMQDGQVGLAWAFEISLIRELINVVYLVDARTGSFERYDLVIED